MNATMSITTIRGTDWTGQRRARVSQLTGSETVGEVVDELVPVMHLPSNVPYAARYGATKLNRSERVSDLGLPDDAELTLAPEVSAGNG